MDNIEGDAHMIISVILYSMVLVLGLLVIVGTVLNFVVFEETFDELQNLQPNVKNPFRMSKLIPRGKSVKLEDFSLGLSLRN